MENKLQKYSELFKEGKIGVIPTDTIYGISASAFLPEAIDKIYKIKNRDPKKPCVVLIGSYADLEKLDINLTEEKKAMLSKFWPARNATLLNREDENREYGKENEDSTNKYEKHSVAGGPGKVSIILPSLGDEFGYLHRGKKTLAVRFPGRKDLAELLQKTGPLISTSANPEGGRPAKNIGEAKKYFGDKIDFYVDEGNLESEPSTLIDFIGDEIKIIKRGG